MKPFIEPYTGLVGRANAVSAPMEQVFEKYQTMCSQGMSDRAIAEALGVNSGLVTRLRYEQPEQWFSQTLIQAFLGQEWGIVRVAFRWPEDTPDEHFPDLLLAPFPPRRCPITDRLFWPTDRRQKYFPDLSEALTRKFRRDPDEARQQYAEMGDWGQRHG